MEKKNHECNKRESKGGPQRNNRKGEKKKPQQEGEIAARTLLKALICNEVRDTGGNAHQEL